MHHQKFDPESTVVRSGEIVLKSDFYLTLITRGFSPFVDRKPEELLQFAGKVIGDLSGEERAKLLELAQAVGAIGPPAPQDDHGYMERELHRQTLAGIPNCGSDFERYPWDRVQIDTDLGFLRDRISRALIHSASKILPPKVPVTSAKAEPPCLSDLDVCYE